MQDDQPRMVAINPVLSKHYLHQMTHVPDAFAKVVETSQHAHQDFKQDFATLKKIIKANKDRAAAHAELDIVWDSRTVDCEHKTKFFERLRQTPFNAGNINTQDELTKAACYDVLLPPCKALGRDDYEQAIIDEKKAGLAILQAVVDKAAQ